MQGLTWIYNSTLDRPVPVLNGRPHPDVKCEQRLANIETQLDLARKALQEWTGKDVKSLRQSSGMMSRLKILIGVGND